MESQNIQVYFCKFQLGIPISLKVYLFYNYDNLSHFINGLIMLKINFAKFQIRRFFCNNFSRFFHISNCAFILQEIKDDVDEHNRPVNHTLDIIAELVENGADVLSSAEISKLQQEGKQLKVSICNLSQSIIDSFPWILK